MTRVKKERNLTEGALIPQILLFALPLIATSILQLLFNTADMVVVGRWGGDNPAENANSLAAVGSCSSLITLLINFFMGLGAGSGICVAHDIGAGREDDVRSTVHTSVILALISGAVVTAIGMLAAGPMLSLMGSDPAVLPEATAYMRAYFCGMPACMLYNFCAAILRAKGDTLRPLIFLSVAGVSNVLFNLFAVLVLRWGAVGVGAATALSQWISCVLIILYMTRMEGPCRIELKKLRMEGAKVRRILRIGVPTGIQSSLFSIANVLIQSTINSFGPIVMAGDAAGKNLDGYVYASQNALYHCSMTFVAQNRGARKCDRIKKSILYSALLVVLIGLSVGTTVWAFSSSLLEIYAPDNPAVIEAGGVRITVMALTYFLCGLMEVGTGAMRGMGKSILPTCVSLVGSCALRIVWIYTVFAYFRPMLDPLQSLMLLYISYPVTWLITSSTHFICVAFEIRKFKKQLAKETPQ
ncbi:MAG: MATE family efflux transporter [Clostridia bacterium]|nr:MATE family efflux transporter [Clostridia bacterium]